MTLQSFMCHWFYRIVIYFAVLFLLVLGITYAPVTLSSLYGKSDFAQVVSFLFNFVIFTTPIFLIEFLCKHSVIKFLGLDFTARTPLYFLKSLLFAIIPFAIIAIVYYSLGKSDIIINEPSVKSIILATIILLVVAIQEEIFFRAFLINSLHFKFNEKISIVISAITFSLLHLGNASSSMLSTTNTFLAGILLGLMYLRTMNLWYPIFFHFFWNFGQALILNSNISSVASNISLFNYDKMDLPKILTGGFYGFENTLICTIILLVLIFVVSKYETLRSKNSSYYNGIKNKMIKATNKNETQATK